MQVNTFTINQAKIIQLNDYIIHYTQNTENIHIFSFEKEEFIIIPICVLGKYLDEINHEHRGEIITRLDKIWASSQYQFHPITYHLK
ncbi:MAG: hypothetical protein INQ03_03305 [Candidatus Heimdallarchaeota archaeon]|nr:hypothetical protein [Candidatus Heimdallarchaeota archaeon]